jgi:glycosyltransferase involved in cell wall biosynthesis
MQFQKIVKNSTILLTSANFFTIAKFRYALISKLISNGCKVVLYSSDDEMSENSIFKLEQLGAICIKTGNGRGSYSLFEAFTYISGYLRILKKYSVDIAINFTLMPMIFGGILCRINKLKYVSVVTGLGSQYHGRSLKRQLLKILYNLSVKHSNQIWFVSNSDSIIGQTILLLNPNKIRVVYGAGVETKMNHNTNSITRNNDETKVICMGRIRKDKGIEDFIKLANNLSESDRISLVLMGNMDTSDDYLRKIVCKANEDNLFTWVSFNYDNLENLRSSEVLLLCSKHEGMPTVILEAMANSVIPISANIPVINELINMGAKIYSYKSGDIESLYKKLKEIQQLSLKERQIIIKSNHKFARKNFDKDNIANIQYKYLSELGRIQ